MITSITRFQLPPGIPTEAIKKGFQEVAPKFQQPSGLLRKYFLISKDGKTGGGVYLWRSMEEARTFSEGVLRPMIRDNFQVEPSIEYFDAPVIVDNVTSEIISDEAFHKNSSAPSPSRNISEK
jgi:Putative mono-oxygenase ydhR